MIGYVKCIDSNKTMSFRVGDCNLFKKIYKNMGQSKELNEY